jgi:hypothetical protein
MALKINKEESELFKLNEYLYKVKVIFKNTNYEIPTIQVMAIKLINKERGVYLIGTRFVDLEDDLSDRLRSQISAEIREQDMRALMGT